MPGSTSAHVYSVAGSMCRVTLPGCDAMHSRSSMSALYVQLTAKLDTCTAQRGSLHAALCKRSWSLSGTSSSVLHTEVMYRNLPFLQ